MPQCHYFVTVIKSVIADNVHYIVLYSTRICSINSWPLYDALFRRWYIQITESNFQPILLYSSSQLSSASEREEDDDEFEESEIISPWGAKRQEMDVDDSDSDVDSDDGLEIFGKETDYTRTFS